MVKSQLENNMKNYVEEEGLQMQESYWYGIQPYHEGIS